MIHKNVPYQHALQNVNTLLYATLEVPKVLAPILSFYVEKSFLNHADSHGNMNRDVLED